MRTDEEVLTPLVEGYLNVPAVLESACMIAEHESRVLWERVWANRDKALLRSQAADLREIGEVLEERVFPEIFSTFTFPFGVSVDLDKLIDHAMNKRACREVKSDERFDYVYGHCYRETLDTMDTIDLLRVNAFENMVLHYTSLAKGGIRAFRADDEKFRDALLENPQRATKLAYHAAYRNGDQAVDCVDLFLSQFVGSLSQFYEIVESLTSEIGEHRRVVMFEIQRYREELLAGKMRTLYHSLVYEQFDYY